MSFAFLPLYTGDYIRDTRHLTPQKHGIYLLLLMHCWDQKGPAPLDEQECAGIANCRSADEIESLRYVLSKYFTKMDDGWYNLRMQGEIERSEAISKSRSDAGKKGYQAKAKQLLNTCLASATTPTPTPTTTKEEKTHTRFSARVYLLGKGIPERNADDYLAIRKIKKLSPTLRAMQKIEEEAAVAGISFVQAIEKCCEHSWAGFKASWLKDECPHVEDWRAGIK